MNLTARIIIALAAAATLALPGAAFAREGESGGKRQTAVAQPVSGSLDDAAGPERETEAVEPTEAAEPMETKQTGDRAERPERAERTKDETGDDAKTGADDAPLVPELAPSFLRRSWKFTASADGFDAEAGVLSATLEKVQGLPKRLRKVRRALADFDAAVLVGPRTRVVGDDGKRLATADVADALDNADEVVVTGKVLAPKSWREDEDGAPLATVRAKRIRVKG